MAEVSAIINSRPLVPVSTDPENPLILTPAMLLTQKTDYIFTSDQLGEFDKRDLCLAEWRRVQALASVFWSRWRKEYLPLLQPRRKWTEDRRDLIKGDVILLKDKNLCRTQWPIGVILKSFKGSDEHVRKAEIIQIDVKSVQISDVLQLKNEINCGHFTAFAYSQLFMVG
ncbi:Hypothetical predicted protein [Mytilus galloprovincialis]|uniref:DUF5641 domain-containing protein n=1 Tax=Mytilus galloprovincialis TaxID=29158 RepID=A0A8B6E8I0_MYTGA|nr:Hypothetical predicted protein [Mytilus galloprovincialis]